jgi:hypothetical protein
MGALIRTANQFKNSDFPTPRGYEQFIRLSIYLFLRHAIFRSSLMKRLPAAARRYCTTGPQWSLPAACCVSRDEGLGEGMQF